jgi:hypothetical protein
MILSHRPKTLCRSVRKLRRLALADTLEGFHAIAVAGDSRDCLTAGQHTRRKEWMMKQIDEAGNEALCGKLIEEFYAKGLSFFHVILL